MLQKSLLRKGGVLSILVVCLGFSAHAELSLYGGSGHDQYLGCFDCNKYSAESICNKHGLYGSKHSVDSIWNRHGLFGSKHSIDSPWNKYSVSNTIPVLVDSDGNFYGYLTINKYRDKAVDFAGDLADVFDQLDGDLELVRDALCES